MNWRIVVLLALVGLMLVLVTIGYDITSAETEKRIGTCIGIGYTNHDRDGGLKCFDETIALDPTSAEAWTEKGDLLALIDRYDEAIKCYQKVTQLYPQSPDAWKNLAEGWVTYAWYKDPAETEADKAAQVTRYDEAIKAYNKAIPLAALSSESDPYWDTNLWLGKGCVLVTLGKYDEAIQSFKKAAELTPEDPGPWVDIGDVQVKQDKYAEAMASYKKAIELAPKQAFPWVAMGYALIQQGKFDDAMAAFDKAIALNPQFSAGWNGKGDTYAAIGKYDDALQSYDKAADLAGKNAYPSIDTMKYFELGIKLEQLHKYDEAIKCFDRVIACQPSYVMGWKTKGDVLKAQGKIAEATTAYAQATTLGYKEANDKEA